MWAIADQVLGGSVASCGVTAFDRLISIDFARLLPQDSTEPAKNIKRFTIMSCHALRLYREIESQEKHSVTVLALWQ